MYGGYGECDCDQLDTLGFRFETVKCTPDPAEVADIGEVAKATTHVVYNARSDLTPSPLSYTLPVVRLPPR